MSVQIGDEVYIRHCQECNEAFKATDSPREQHCSHECYYLDRGEGALNQLASDHTVCSSCFKYIKSISTPEQSWLDDKADWVGTVLDHGGEYTDSDDEIVLDATDAAEKRFTSADSIVGYQFPTEHTDYLEGKWICECGNGNIHERDEVLAGLELETTITLLLTRLQEFYDKGAIHAPPTERVFFDTFDEDERNWKLAVGKCLEE